MTPEEKLRKASEALRVIAGGRIDQFPGGPRIESGLLFQSGMWKWSQKVAHSALDVLEAAEDAE